MYAGAILSNVAISLAAPVVYVCIAAVVSAIKKKPMAPTMKSPALSFAVEHHFRGVVLSCAFVLLWNAQDAGLRAMGAVVVFLYALVVVGSVFVLGARGHSTYRRTAPSGGVPVPLWRRDDGTWDDLVGFEGYVKQFGGVFEAYRGPSLWFDGIELGITIVNAGIAGVVPMTMGVCAAKTAGYLALIVIRLALLGFLMPFRRGQKLCLVCVIDGLKAAGTVVVLASLLAGNSSALWVAKVLLMAASAVAALGGAHKMYESVQKWFGKKTNVGDAAAAGTELAPHPLEASLLLQPHGAAHAPSPGTKPVAVIDFEM